MCDIYTRDRHVREITVWFRDEDGVAIALALTAQQLAEHAEEDE